MWIPEDIENLWTAEYRHKGRGHQPVYSNDAILSARPDSVGMT